MARYLLEIRYNGLAFHGSQLQGDTPTVQLAINKALSTLLRGDISSYGASRTDEGVHALCNYYHFDTNRVLTANFVYKLNAILPYEIGVNRMFLAKDPEFNCRFAAISRQYRYRIYFKKDPFKYQRALYHPYKINRAILDETAKALLEFENFETFSKRNTQSYTFICKLTGSHWEDHEDELHYVVRGNRFLRGMVRGLVGTQLNAAKGKLTVDDFRKVIEARNCTLADFSVTGHGLYLEDIVYPEGELIEITD
ncbi:MAG: tRNA pseudouridine synthase A [Chitinophagales bacterium]|nr:tRNA pseudouridine synthase A [Chitinophagales bacterium]